MKSTVPLGFFKQLPHYDFNLVFAPEFLHAQTAVEDLINPKFVVASGSKAEQLIDIYHWIPRNRFHIVSYETATVIKLAMNIYAATKISFVNELEQICDDNNANVEKVLELLRLEGRMAEPYSHARVGAYGGSCLPKDSLEVVNASSKTILMRAVHEVNEKAKKRYG